jgi:hypothetical protein
MVVKWAEMYEALAIHSMAEASDWGELVNDKTRQLFQYLHEHTKAPEPFDDDESMSDGAPPPDTANHTESEPPSNPHVAESLSKSIAVLVLTNATLTTEIISLKKHLSPLDKATTELQNDNRQLRAKVDDLIIRNADITVQIGNE